MIHQDKKVSRRQYLKYMSLFGLGAIAPTVFVKPLEANVNKIPKTSKTLPLMNTLVNITLYDVSPQKAKQAQDKAFNKIKKLISVFNRFDPNTPLSWLNNKGKLQNYPQELALVLKKSKQLSSISNRAFDITILPLLELYKYSLQESGKLPSWNQIQDKMSGTGIEKVHISNNKIKLLHPETQITLDGIAKGFIVDMAAEIIRKEDISYGLINAGGDIRTIGSNRGKPWSIGIKDPLGKKQYVQKIALQDMAIATSGNYENYFDPFGRHHHLIRQSLGTSPQRSISATAIAPSAMMADGLSTAFFVLAPEKSIALANSLKQVQANIIVQGGRAFYSKGWNSFVL